MPTLRRADVEDAREVAALAERTFRDTFAAGNAAEDMDLHCGAHYGEEIQRRELMDPDRVTLVAEEGGGLVGYAQLRWGPAPACVAASAPGEILRFYVDRPWHGRRLAHDLMEACLDAIAARGSDVAWLGVFAANARAIAFYAKHGFVPVGEQVFRLGRDPQRDLVMARRIESRARC